MIALKTPLYKVLKIPSIKILFSSKLTAFADDKIKVAQRQKFVVLEYVENIVGNGENAGYQHFLLFHNVFFSYKDKNHLLSFIKKLLCT